ncbi:MAG: segregation/condensation protein A [Candidatus Thermoplasmatota archaeon]|nr:segregation/condensation protein A [Candidatus Thermoplasmatota archaeon]
MTAGAYEIKLDIFEGPLDLLLYLIRKNEVDIYDIPIALITRQYMKYIDAMKSLNLDLAGEYLVLAATLTHIKSRMLLPVSEEDEEEEDVDPREELVKQLLEYKAFKEAALGLDRMSILGRDVFGRDHAGEEVEKEEQPLMEIGIFELVEAFRRISLDVGQKDLMEIDIEKISLSDRINDIVDELERRGELTFTDLLEDAGNRRRLIYTFLAILELVKLRIIKAYQAVPYGTIRICLAGK